MIIMIISSDIEVFTVELVEQPKLNHLMQVQWLTPELGRNIEYLLDGQMLGDTAPYNSEHRLLVSPDLFKTALEAMGYQVEVFSDSE